MSCGGGYLSDARSHLPGADDADLVDGRAHRSPPIGSLHRWYTKLIYGILPSCLFAAESLNCGGQAEMPGTSQRSVKPSDHPISYPDLLESLRSLRMVRNILNPKARAAM